MAKVFTITEGLENLGALKTGGQGSVYKGKRIGEIFTAVKLLPTPIHAEDATDKNYKSFSNEVEKLKKVNEDPSPNVVRILGSGITETGCLPFIEMEFIEGPDLGELLKHPHDPVFTISEVIKVACHLSNALAHCHKCDVKHGDIKSNNVKFNKLTGNYVLLDFGLALMSDEDRRTSFRNAGAIEFMAPEQNGGAMLFQTDVYSFGVIIFELLAGRVPFPLHDSGETARNAVMLSHMETPPPDVLELRRENLPDDWGEEKKELEMQVPEWLTNMMYKCLEKKPEDRFENGEELYEYIILNSSVAAKKKELITADTNALQFEIEKLMKEKDQLQKQVLNYQEELQEKEEDLSRVITTGEPSKKTVSRPAFYAVLVLAMLFGGLTLYSFLHNRSANAISSQILTDSLDSIKPNTLSTESSKTGKTEQQQTTTTDVQTVPTSDEMSKQQTVKKSGDTSEIHSQLIPKRPQKKTVDSISKEKSDTTNQESSSGNLPEN